MSTRPASISARMSLSERSTPRGYARGTDRRQPRRGVVPCPTVPLPLALLEADRHHTAEPGTPWTSHEPAGAEPLGLLHRERTGAEHVPIGTADDGALHQVPESLPQE